jgi:transcriptional regulator GlxA family with amidase domain
MIRTNDLLKNVLVDVEEGIRNGITTDIIAKKHTLSSIHLQRLFKVTFKQSLGAYIRSRRLMASLDGLRNNNKLIDIAHEYGFRYEQSYLRSFKREFGTTPGKLRKALNNGGFNTFHRL